MTAPATQPIHIVGAGPVGALLGCLLGQAGQAVTVWEKRTQLPDCSMAIGITPPSLDILDTLQLGDSFRQQGVLIRNAQVYENRTLSGSLSFASPRQSILSLPQADTLRILRKRLQELPSVDFRFGEAFPSDIPVDPTGSHAEAPWVIACDGHRSRIRQQAGIPLRTRAYGLQFIMADFPDEENLGPDARLYFSPRGAVESFPLPAGKRRWISQCPDGESGSLELLVRRVQDAAGIDLQQRTHSTLWPFSPTWGMAATFTKGRVLLCGDAAHQMSPIGGQGMNTGFADAELLANTLLNDPSPAAWAAYTRTRQRAFRAAARRAALGMALGSRTGERWSQFRHHLISWTLHHRIPHNTLSRTFSMRNLPA
jgi:2-polyprenyl-6-methoxyphenol hydroxylase-like FAD-dependent oxidoreductase